ncbi:hypothetical protein [Moheibacter sediminis]|uniref:hypothetical protein n=1 Tax=Moheibacter sediminis TaxID=1434700 RepID=UPI000A0502F7|nr:hypothetical protein [Moheibacter sediminis]
MQFDLKVLGVFQKTSQPVGRGFDSHLQILIEVAQLVRVTVMQVRILLPVKIGKAEWLTHRT